MTRALFKYRNGQLSGAVVITSEGRSPQVIPVNFRRTEPEPCACPDFEARVAWAFAECIGVTPDELAHAREIMKT